MGTRSAASTAGMVADAVAVGRGLGLRVDDPVVLSDNLNLLVHLRPSPVVARIQNRTGLVREADVLAVSSVWPGSWPGGVCRFRRRPMSTRARTSAEPVSGVLIATETGVLGDGASRRLAWLGERLRLPESGPRSHDDGTSGP